MMCAGAALEVSRGWGCDDFCILAIYRRGKIQIGTMTVAACSIHDEAEHPSEIGVELCREKLLMLGSDHVLVRACLACCCLFVAV